MRSAFRALATLAFAALVQAVSLQDVCTTTYVTASLPSDSIFLVNGQYFYPDGTFDYCDITFAYSHNGLDDQVLVTYWLPAPAQFQNRHLSTGGGGLAINSGSSSFPGGILYGAVAGLTDGGFGSFENSFDSVFLIKNGTINWQSGCSEGGREGWSQVQRYGDEWDGAVAAAPALRYGHQQVQHMYSNVVEKTMNYYPPPCELAKIVNEAIAACDGLDGKVDGVVARTDLCKLHFNINTTIGQPYFCAATEATLGGIGMGPPAVAQPAQNGTVAAKGVAVASQIVEGLHDLQGRRVYLSYKSAASFVDAQTQYNSATKAWELSISGFGGEWVERYLNLLNTSTLSALNNVTYDTLKEWIIEGWQIYEDTLQTTNPDLTPFHTAGGKVIHFHGESNDSIPTASSVRYYESVRSIMYPNMTYNESNAALQDWYRLYLVPGAAHCSPSSLQPNRAFPQTSLHVLINWVEKGVKPTTLNATALQGVHQGENRQICAWPLRPYWTNNGTTMECQYDQASTNIWMYDFDAFKLPVY